MSAVFALFYYIVVPSLSICAAVFWLKRAKEPKAKRFAQVVCALWFIWLGWHLFGVEKILLDWKVDRLCAKDGGIKVYETVELPAEIFDKWGNYDVPSKREMEVTDEYYYERETVYFKQGNPDLYKSHYKVFRRSDGKLLGEKIRYARRGGDLPGPWHPSSYSCPDNLSLFKKIFNKSDKKVIDNDNN